MNDLNLYIVFVYNSKKFQECRKVVSHLDWHRISSSYFGDYLKTTKKQILTWYLAAERTVDSIKYAELNLLDDAVVVDENCREADITEFRREFIMRKLAGI